MTGILSIKKDGAQAAKYPCALAHLALWRIKLDAPQVVAGYLACAGHGILPERMGNPPQAYAQYKVIHGIVDWSKGELIQDECFDLGVHATNYYFIQPIDDRLLLLGARTDLLKNGSYQNNAFIINPQGRVIIMMILI